MLFCFSSFNDFYIVTPRRKMTAFLVNNNVYDASRIWFGFLFHHKPKHADFSKIIWVIMLNLVNNVSGGMLLFPFLDASKHILMIYSA